MQLVCSYWSNLGKAAVQSTVLPEDEVTTGGLIWRGVNAGYLYKVLTNMLSTSRSDDREHCNFPYKYYVSWINHCFGCNGSLCPQYLKLLTANWRRIILQYYVPELNCSVKIRSEHVYSIPLPVKQYKFSESPSLFDCRNWRLVVLLCSVRSDNIRTAHCISGWCATPLPQETAKFHMSL